MSQVGSRGQFQQCMLILTHQDTDTEQSNCLIRRIANGIYTIGFLISLRASIMQNSFFQPNNPYARTSANSKKRQKRDEVFSSASTPGYVEVTESLQDQSFPKRSTQFYQKSSLSESGSASSLVCNSF